MKSKAKLLLTLQAHPAPVYTGTKINLFSNS